MKVQKQIKSNCGIYILEIFVPKCFSPGIPKFKKNKINYGFYYYVGSAQKNLRQRIERHLNKNKIIHWHIDHITAAEKNKIESVFIFENHEKNFECTLAAELEMIYELKHPLNKFGNSDCRSCKSHLLYSKNKIDHSHLFSRYQSIVRFMPSSSETS